MIAGVWALGKFEMERRQSRSELRKLRAVTLTQVFGVKSLASPLNAHEQSKPHCLVTSLPFQDVISISVVGHGGHKVNKGLSVVINFCGHFPT